VRHGARLAGHLGAEPGSGLVVVPDNFMSVHRDPIISLTAQFRIPAIYPYRYFAEAGGLASQDAPEAPAWDRPEFTAWMP
jgi:hypothetical protein